MTVESPLPIKGQNAYDKILSKLCGNSLAEQLAMEVFRFYGEVLTYSESREIPTSSFWFNFQREPFFLLEEARIWLKLDTGRESEALAHELLHLQLPIRGFALIEGTEMPEEMPQESAKVIMDMYTKIQNLVHHEINIAVFKGLGYLKRHFLGGTSPPPFDYGPKVLNPLPHIVNAPQEYSWWCLEYFRHWISLRHGNTLDVNNYANEALQWGAKQHPSLKQAADGMREWVISGEFKKPDRYIHQVNNLLEIMKIPKVTIWALLECTQSQNLVAKRIEL